MTNFKQKNQWQSQNSISNPKNNQMLVFYAQKSSNSLQKTPIASLNFEISQSLKNSLKLRNQTINNTQKTAEKQP
jgi:hypothetical protein